MTMLRITERLTSARHCTVSVTLPFDQRQRTRQLLRLDDGREAALLLPRGTVLRGGDKLLAEDGEVIDVLAAEEEVTTAFCVNPMQLARAAYHLGNRHIAVQVSAGWVRYARDHVLDQMLQDMGLQITHEIAPFEPEAGAYHKHE